ncbi:MAG: cardiolipin synthase [Burkholderiales bacterium]
MADSSLTDSSLTESTREARPAARVLAAQAFSRAAGAPLVRGNRIRLLKDAKENYPAWLEAICFARDTIHFENYIIRDDDIGQKFADAFIMKAKEGLRVRVLYDWMGSGTKTSGRFWRRLVHAGVEVRCFNPPRFDRPLGWVSRDHRKSICVDNRIAFVSGLCVGQEWVGCPERGIPPWRDTGVELHGPAVADVAQAFARAWTQAGPPLPTDEMPAGDPMAEAGSIDLRVVATVPVTAGMYRLDQLIAALAQRTLWLTDAYFVGGASYVQALRAAARDGVDVRLLVPGSSGDIKLLRPVSRAGYHPLMDAGVRVFEWNGSMLHAKSAVADGRWARVGSSNLNAASWLGNWELDVAVEDRQFAHEMEQAYLDDLGNATEIVLDQRHRIYPLAKPPRQPAHRRAGGSAGRLTAGAIRVGNTVGAAITERRIVTPADAKTMMSGALVLLALAAVVLRWPLLLAAPVALFTAWVGAALLIDAWRLHRRSQGGAESGRTENDIDEPIRKRETSDRDS